MAEDADVWTGPPSEPESWLAEVAAAPAVPIAGSAEQLREGAVVDEHYEIEGVLGVGGMGIVYRAYDLALDRPVALKLHHSTDAQARERLLREAKVMAKLSHPNVVAVHEVGTWRGHVYFAAELVEGTTARQWQKEGRPWAEVVRLYMDAGAGLAAAHRIGLVHRDFKPANILVGDDGRARVADFGLARPVGPQEGSAADVSVSSSSGRGPTSGLVTNLTRTGTRMGTPAYMPPEQFMAEELDGRADQFAFCVSLFEGLYGKRPFPGRSAAAVAAAIGRGPQRPAGASRVPRRLYRALCRGLAPDPNDRFATMEDLLSELGAVVRPPKRWAWALGGIIAVGGGTLAVVGANEVAVEGDCAATRAEIDAVWSAARADTVAQAVGRADASAMSPWSSMKGFVDDYAHQWQQARVEVCEGMGGRTTELVDRAYACLDEGRRDLDLLLGALEDASGAVRRPTLNAFQLLVRPHECLDADFVMRSAPLPADPDDRARAVEARAQLRRLRRVKVTAGTLQSVLDEVARHEAVAREIGYAPLRAEAGLTHGTLLRTAGEAQAAVPVYEDAYFVAHEAGDHRLASKLARTLASLVGYTMGRTEPATLWARLAVGEALQGGVPIGALASAEHHLGMVHDGAGHWEQADVLYERALQRLVGDDSDYRLTRAQILVSIAALEGGRGKIDAAIGAANEAIALYDEVYGPRHGDTIAAIGNIGFALHAAGRYEEAYQWHERAFSITKEVHGADHAQAITCLSNLAAAAHAMGNVAVARQHYAESERIVRLRFGDEHPEIAAIASNLALLADDEGKFEHAAELRAKAVKINMATIGPDAPGTLTARAGLARAQLRAGRLDEGCATFDEIVAIIAREQGESANLADARSGQGECAQARGQSQAAAQHHREAAAIATKANAAALTRAAIQFRLAKALWPDDPESGRAAARRAHALHTEAGHGPAIETVQAWLDAHPVSDP